MNRRQRKQRVRERTPVETGGAPRKQQGDKLESQIPRRDPHDADAIASSQRAQRSEVHETTDDAATSPASDVRTPKPRPEDQRRREPHPAPNRDVPVEPDGGRLLPGSRRDRDESDFGGPARIETDERGRLKE